MSLAVATVHHRPHMTAVVVPRYRRLHASLCPRDQQAVAAPLETLAEETIPLAHRLTQTREGYRVGRLTRESSPCLALLRNWATTSFVVGAQ